MKFIITFLCCLIPIQQVMAGNDDTQIDDGMFFVTDVLRFTTSSNLSASIYLGKELTATNSENCHVVNGSICQSFSGGVGIQSIAKNSRNSKGIEHIAAAVVGSSNSSTQANTYQDVRLTGVGKTAQNCGADICIQVIK